MPLICLLHERQSTRMTNRISTQESIKDRRSRMDRKYTPRVSCLASLCAYQPELRRWWVTLNCCRASRAHHECTDREIERTRSTLRCFERKRDMLRHKGDEGKKAMLNSSFTIPAIPRLAIPSQHLRLLIKWLSQVYAGSSAQSHAFVPHFAPAALHQLICLHNDVRLANRPKSNEILNIHDIKILLILGCRNAFHFELMHVCNCFRLMYMLHCTDIDPSNGCTFEYML